MSSKSKKSRSRSKSHNASRMHNAYPSMPAYPMPAPQWIPPQPYQWYQPLSNMPHMSNANVPWMPPPGSNSATISPKTGIVPGPQDEYMVDSLRRIYNNDDGSIEIERVKVQRRQGIYDTKQGSMGAPSESQSLVPASHFLNDRRPPPRKHKRKVTDVARMQDDAVPVQGWYPYMPYMPQPFPYAYPYGYVWPMPPHSPLNMHPQFHSPTDDSDSSASHHEPFLVSMDSPDLLQAKSISPESQRRPPSSATGSHIAESLGTDIAPSDSVSMRGFKRETSIERILRKSLANSKDSIKTTSQVPTSKDIEKTKEWMEDMQKAFESKSGFSSELTGDRSSFTTAPSDIPTPPLKHKIMKNSTSKIILTHRKSNSESNIDDHEDQKNTNSLPLLENTRVSESDLPFALKATNNNRSDRFGGSSEHKNELSEDNFSKIQLTSDHGGRDSCTSTTSFHSTRQSADENIMDTDSTDIAIPLDSSTADEQSVENFDEDTIIDDFHDKSYKWILQSVEDLSSEGEQNEEKNTNEIIESWRTEVSLWRARLVVSLCRGQGLDQQDWGTFHLLVQHPLSIDMKLSLLHAQRLCSQNYDVGVALLRNSLLHLTTFGETLMKPENERASGWKTITIDSNQPWVLIKGSVEILRVFGFRIKGNGTLRFRKKYSPEISVIARLTLDMLVLAEEFRLFLNGAHQYPINITQLFTATRDFKYDKVYRSKSAEQENRSDSIINEQLLISDSLSSNFTEVQHSQAGTHEKQDSMMNVTPPPSISLIQNISAEILNDQNENKSTHESSELSTPTKQSLTDLLSPSVNLAVKHENSDRESGSRETLIPTPPPQIGEAGVSEQIKGSSAGNNSGKGKIRKVVNGKDNPEDHVYEEIGDIKEQVEELRRSESASQSPPPLPPKTKNSQNEDLYPQVNWSISSQYSSVHGSASRRKKRRAPMPPEFFNYENKELDSDITKKNETGLPIASVAIDKTCESNTNPFYEDRIKPKGFVGKNPFYEDLVTDSNLDTKHQTHQEAEATKTTLKEALPYRADDTMKEKHKESTPINTTLDVSLIYDTSEISSCSTFPPGVRPQRRKKKIDIKKIKTENKDAFTFSEEMSYSKDDISSTLNEKSIINDHSNIEPPQNTVSSFSKSNTSSKNDAREHQCRSQVAVPNESKITAGLKKNESNECEKKDVILQKISITYDISLDDKAQSNIKEISLKTSNTVDAVEVLKINKRSNEIKDSLEKSCSSNTNDNLKQRSENIIQELTSSNDSQTLKSNSKSSHEYAKVEKEKTEENNVPPLLPPKSALRLIDDIPYIDSNDVKKYKKSYLKFERQQPAHYGLSELNSNVVSDLPKSSTEGKLSNFLKLSSTVPFIDDSDLPPDSEPPSPPPSPPLPPPSPPTLSMDSTSFSDSLHTILIETPKADKASLPLLISKPNQLLNREVTEKSQIQESFPLTSASDLKTLSDSVPLSENVHQKTSISALHKSENSPDLSDSIITQSNTNIINYDLPKTLLPDHVDLPSSSQDSGSLALSSSPPNESVFHIEPLEDSVKPPSPPDSPPPSPNSLLPLSMQKNSQSENHLLLKDGTDANETKQNTNFISVQMTDTEMEIRENLENYVFEDKKDMNNDNEMMKPEISKSQLLQEKEDSEHKSLMLFGTENTFKMDNIPSQDTGSPQYEIPETPKFLDTEEERYEIPDVIKSNENSNIHHTNLTDKKHLYKTDGRISAAKKQADNNIAPKRPPRHLQSFKVPPPRPPKPDTISCPPLPPKTGPSRSSKSNFDSSKQSTSLPSTLVKPSNNNRSHEKRIQPSPLAIPAMYRSIPDSISKSKQETFKTYSLTSIPTTQNNKILTNSSTSSKKILPKSSKPHSECVSLPSSPKAIKPALRKDAKDDKKQKSWPFLLCDCVHPAGSNDDIKYVFK